jgi:hypothetical protein
MRSNRSAHVVSPTACLHGDDAHWQLGGERNHRLTPQTPPDYDRTAIVKTHHTAAVFAKINPKYRNLHWFAPSSSRPAR